ncbi:MAG: T9SS type A sorting domain-containing protein, partial [Ignavibacteriae bacterium]|nr:T9SS type A sorting domain-containing protein [Ignavibacteriota bacterium]
TWNTTFHKIITVVNIPNSSEPSSYRLFDNYPNPFNPVTNLEFGISELGFVSLKVYDILGKEVKTLVNEIKQAGNYKVQFDGSSFASGVYFYELRSGDFVARKRMVLLK